MRYLGIDYGVKRIGLAISDEGGVMAFPYAIVDGGEGAVHAIAALVRKEGVEAAVLGESKDFSGAPNPIARYIALFKDALERESGLSIVYEPEFMTSAQAARPIDGEARAVAAPSPRAKDGPVDAKAATLILQSYLDKMQGTKH